MPIYTFKCKKHGTFDMIFPISRSDITFITCDHWYKKDGKVYQCNRIAERQVELCAMQPDKYWAGHIVHGKYVTKRSQVDKNIEPYKRDTAEYVAKRKQEHITEKQEKHKKDLRKFLENEIVQYDFGLDGATTKQRRKDAERRTTTTE